MDESSFLSPAELVERRLSSPMINLSGSVQIAPKAWLISENYYFFSPEFFEVNQVGSLGSEHGTSAGIDSMNTQSCFWRWRKAVFNLYPG